MVRGDRVNVGTADIYVTADPSIYYFSDSPSSSIPLVPDTNQLPLSFDFGMCTGACPPAVVP